VKTFKVKDPRKWFYCFWFFNHSLKWFLIVSPKDAFIQLQWFLHWCKQFFLCNLSDQKCNCNTFQGSHITTKKIIDYKRKIERIFDMKNLRRMRKYVRVEISHPPTHEIFLIREDVNIWTICKNWFKTHFFEEQL